MTMEEQKRLYELVQNPPPRSKIEAAKHYGVDLNLTLRRLAMSPTQRAQAMGSALELAEELQGATATPARMNGLATALKALTDGKVNFIIVGGFAAVAHGWLQITQDLDLCYERSPENLKRLAVTLAPYHPRLPGVPGDVPFLLDERTLLQGMNFTLQTDLGDIDLLGDLSGVGQFPEVARDAVSLSLFGSSCKIASLETVIRSKRAAGRPKDLYSLSELEALKELRDKPKKKREKS